MSSLAVLLDSLLPVQAPTVLATLVQVKGSSYRRPGARMLLDPEGIRMGVLSGGCLETDLAARVADILARGGAQVVKYDMSSELDRIWGTGMGCQGKADILLVPLAPGQAPDWARAARAALAGRRPGVILTVYQAADPTRLGQAWFWEPGDGEGAGLPGDLAGAARAALAEGRPAALDRDGERILVEPLLPPVALWIFGAGENARPLAEQAMQLGWAVGILDHRPALARPERFPGAAAVLAGPPATLAGALSGDPRSAGVVMTHIFEPDKAMLRHMLETGMPYVGLQGNRGRSEQVLSELEQEGFALTEERLRRLRVPMGLDLGAESPEIIALAVLAEIQAVLSGRAPIPLRERRGRIHD
jgi:xanthine/CO dehydrogenase XdhC/CoxF family maturation factor